MLAKVYFVVCCCLYFVIVFDPVRILAAVRNLSSNMHFCYFLLINLVCSILTHFFTYNLIPKFGDMFINAKIFGVDVNKITKDKMYVFLLS